MSDWDNQVLCIDNDIQDIIELLKRVVDAIPYALADPEGVDPKYKLAVKDLEAALELVKKAHETWSPLAQKSREYFDLLVDKYDAP